MVLILISLMHHIVSFDLPNHRSRDLGLHILRKELTTERNVLEKITNAFVELVSVERLESSSYLYFSPLCCELLSEQQKWKCHRMAIITICLSDVCRSGDLH